MYYNQEKQLDQRSDQSPLLQQLSSQFQNQIQQISNQPQIKNNVNNLEHIDGTLKDITNNDSQFTDLKFVYTVPQIVDPDPITCIIEPNEELCGLYIGNYEAASNVDLLRKYKIRAVLTASIETGLKYAEEVIHFHEIIQAHDNENYDIVQHFEKAFDFIDRHRKYTSVLVHCFAGISRSASLIIAYLMKKYNLNFEKALWKLKSRRRQVNPNVGFVRQLQKYEKALQSLQSQIPAQINPIIPQGQTLAYPIQQQQKVVQQNSKQIYPTPLYQYNIGQQQIQTPIQQISPSQLSGQQFGTQQQNYLKKETDQVNPRNSFFNYDQQYFVQQNANQNQQIPQPGIQQIQQPLYQPQLFNKTLKQPKNQ